MEDTTVVKIKEEPEDDFISRPAQFSIYAGTKSGILKALQPGPENLCAINYPRSSKLSKDNEITALAWRSAQKNEVLIGHANRTVSLFDCSSLAYVFRMPVNFGKGKITSITPRNGNILVGVESGHAGYLFKGEKGNGPASFIDTLKGTKFHLFKKHKPTLAVIRPDPTNETRFATGGCENDLKIWDLNADNRLVFAARNVANDMLDLRVPIWISDLTYMHDQRTVAVVSRHNCVRLYDPRAKRRPVMNLKYEESPITCVTTAPLRENWIVMGTAHGRVTLYDVRKNIRNRAPVVFKNINGAIKDVACLPNDSSTVYSVSLDRYFRVHDLDSKQTIYKEYLKSKLTKVLV